MNGTHTLNERIARVERKLELRRARTSRHAEEIRTGIGAEVERVRSWMPIASAAGALLFGFAAARRGGRHDAGSSAPVRRGLVASLVATVGMLARIALSPTTRALWASLRKQREA